VRPLLTPRWLAGHALAALLVLASAGLTWWQVSRALGGNFLSYGYAFFWPAFAAFVVMIWVREMRLSLGREPVRTADPEQPTEGFGRPVHVTRPVTSATEQVPADDDPELAEYNRLLAWLAANPGARPADYPASRPPADRRQPTQMQETP
jgi:DNA-binding transcriptional regulator of glucitol operon